MVVVVLHYPNYFPPIFIIWKENHSLNALHFFYVYFLVVGQNDRRTPLNFKMFHNQTITNLLRNATEVVRFLKYVQKRFL